MTLLEAHIKYKSHDFIEPERKGIPKGHEIGKSRGRFLAELYSMYDLDLKEIANHAGITYAFLRKLRSEKSFQESAAEEMSWFVEDMFIYFMSGGTIELNPDLPARECPTTENGIKDIKLDPEAAFADSALYSRDLKIMFTDTLIKVLERKDSYDIERDMNRLYYLMSQWNEPELNKTIYKVIMNYGEELICKTLGDVEATSEMRARAINFTQLIAKLSTTL